MKKAISNVIALVLILIIAIVASVSVFVWVLSIQEDMTHHSYSVQERFLRTAKSSIETLSDTFFNSTLYVELINTGTTTIPLEEARIYLVLEDEGLQSICNSGNLAEGGNFQATIVRSHLAPGETINIAIDVNTDNCNILPNRQYKYILVFPDGISVSGYFRLSTQDPGFHEDSEDLSNLTTFVNTIFPYEITSSPLTITATGNESLDTVTLYYRYSLDNFSMPQLNNILLHFDATTITGLSDGDRVTQWNDLSGNEYHFSQSGDNRPYYDLFGINNLPAINFAREGWFERAGNLLDNSIAATVVVVVDPVDVETRNYNQHYFSAPLDNTTRGFNIGIRGYETNSYWFATRIDGTSYNSVSAYDLPQDNVPIILTGMYDQNLLVNQQRLYVNGSIVSQRSASGGINNQHHTMFIGRGSERPESHYTSVHGKVGEIIVINGSISEKDLKEVHNYLSRKWNIGTNRYINWTSWGDSSFPYSWEFEFPEGTGYYEFFSIGSKNESSEEMKTKAEAIGYYEGDEEILTTIDYIEDLNNVRNNLDANYLLMQNLDFCEESSYETPNSGDIQLSNLCKDEGATVGWNPIGTFSGKFDGNKYTISNLFINRTDTGIGLFSETSLGSEIYRIGLIDVNITGSRHLGSLVGNHYGGIIYESYATGNIISTSNSSTARVGGLIGYVLNSEVRDSWAGVNITNNEGGIRFGGFAGQMASNTYINNSYSYGFLNVIEDWSNGGFVGRNMNGDNDLSTPGCFFDNQTSNKTTSQGGTGKTTIEMQKINIFENANWTISGTLEGLDPDYFYPFLSWQANISEPTWLIFQIG